MSRRKPSWSMHGTGVTRKEDQWFSKAIRQRDRWQCRVPGCSASKDAGDQVDCCHIESRRHLATRWDPDNAITMCRTHHGYYEDRPTEFTLMLLSIGITEDELTLLIQRRNQIMKAPDHVRQSISDHYRKECRRMERDGEADLVSWSPDYENDKSAHRATG